MLSREEPFATGDQICQCSNRAPSRSFLVELSAHASANSTPRARTIAQEQTSVVGFLESNRRRRPAADRPRGRSLSLLRPLFLCSARVASAFAPTTWRALCRSDGKAEDCARSRVNRGKFDVALDLLRKGVDEGQPKSFLWRELHAAPVVLHRDTALAGVADERESYLDLPTAVSKRVLDAVGDELVDDQAGGNGAIDRYACRVCIRFYG